MTYNEQNEDIARMMMHKIMQNCLY